MVMRVKGKDSFCFNLSLSEWCWVLHPLIQLLWSSLVCLSNSTRSVGTSFQTNRKPKWKKGSSSTGQRNGMQQYPAWIGKWRAQQVSWSYCKYEFFIAMRSIAERFPQYKPTPFTGGLRKMPAFMRDYLLWFCRILGTAIRQCSRITNIWMTAIFMCVVRSFDPNGFWIAIVIIRTLHLIVDRVLGMSHN